MQFDLGKPTCVVVSGGMAIYTLKLVCIFQIAHCLEDNILISTFNPSENVCPF